MDILDIDEALKDDSFIFLEDKTHDDVSNILQQWKSNNNFLSTQQQLQQQHQQQLQLQQQQHQQEQAYKLNSRTFTRPRRKSTQNLESQFLSAIQNNPQQQQQQNGAPILNLEIGGLVTTMHKSFLQDTSPPSSICSSMDVSIERMNNSLITSADFSNINFLQSTQSLDFSDANGGLGGIFNLANKTTSDGYTLSDMIRDRQALESLTMSGDGTLIKDTEIGQIDDISLLLSKTASSCSTMDNSTESVEGSNKTVELEPENRTYEAPQLNSTRPQSEAPIMQRTMVLSEEMIGDTTFNLVDSSLYEERIPVKGAGDGVTLPNQTFKQPTTVMNETVCITATQSDNSTLEKTLEKTQNLPVDSTRCETPEQIKTTDMNAKMYESTPQATSVRYNKQSYTPSIKIADDVNISPIIAPKTPQMKAPRRLNETYEPHETSQKVQATTFSTGTPVTHLEAMDEELLDNVENPNETYNKSIATDVTQNIAGMEMQSVMDLAQAEAELLADNDEEQFEHILNEISKVELNAEQLKMKHSLDSIKKRFNCNLNGSVSGDKQEREGGGRVDSTLPAGLLQDEINAQRQFKHDMDLRNEDLRKLKESMRECRSSRETLQSSGLSNSSGSCGSGERLLSRRSRLYDDINLSACGGNENKSSTSGTASTSSLSTGSLSNTIPKANDSPPEQEISADTSPKTEVEGDAMATATATAASNAYKLAERRERDRERFKTIKIVKQRSGNGENGEPVVELNVPCIDDDFEAAEQNVETAAHLSQRYSRRDQVEIPESQQNGSKLSQNYLTYKKPRDKQIPKHKLPEIGTGEEETTTTTLNTTITKVRSTEARSLSRPRFLSGLQKFSAVSKATSAGDLEHAPNTTASNTTANTSVPTIRNNTGPTPVPPSVNFNRTQPLPSNNEKMTQPGELKSPMGIKSKSFHNLSSNFGYNSGNAPKLSTYGLRKPQSGGVLIEKQAKSNVSQRGNTVLNSNQQLNSQKSDETVFKVPRLVSGLRAPSTAAGRRALPVRPSSGYYSLNVNAKQMNVPTNDADLDAGRHSPTDSMSSASSRGSAQSIGNSNGNGNGSGSGSGLNVASTKTNSAETLLNGTATLTKITTSSTGIPKPSGLKPPSNVKRSGLPRPASMIRR